MSESRDKNFIQQLYARAQRDFVFNDNGDNVALESTSLERSKGYLLKTISTTKVTILDNFHAGVLTLVFQL